MTCPSFDAEMLAALEGGANIAHLTTCDTCQARVAEIERVKSLLGAVPVRDEGDWEARIWARVAAEKPSRGWLPWLGGLLAAAGLIAVLLPVFLPAPTPPLEWSVAAGEARQLRGSAAHPGDRLLVRTAPEADLRLFREDALHARCAADTAPPVPTPPGGPPCRPGTDALKAELVFGPPGRYRLVSLRGGRPVEPALGLDATLGAARAAGAEVETSLPIEVE